MKILVANIGSTSLKWRLFDFSGDRETVLHQGGFERVGDYSKAIADCLSRLLDSGAIRTENELAAVGFKTVLARGLTGCVRLDEESLMAMEDYSALAPAHNPAYVNGIRLFARRVPGTPLVGLFETAYYQWAPEAAMRYAVPEAWHKAGVRRLGFHGASHKYIAERSAELLGREDIVQRVRRLYVDGASSTVAAPSLRVISCHLGGSSSITGILNGVAVGNSLGMSPQSGLPHNNRVGDLDAFALTFMMREGALAVEDVEEQMCTEGGLKGVSGVSNDIRDITARASAGDERAKLALDLYVHEARRWIGAYLMQLNGVDALVFTAGIGENRPEIREAICQDLDQLGIRLDPEANAQVQAREAEIGRSDSRTKIMVIPTNEELVVAREVKRLLENS